MVFQKKSAERTEAVADYLDKIRSRRPVVQCITNIVTVNDCANALLAIGASPTMAHHPQEMADFAAICDSLVCNLGATESLEAMEKAVSLAAKRRHPVVLDPVGCAGSPFRREQAMRLIGAGRGAAGQASGRAGGQFGGQAGSASGQAGPIEGQAGPASGKAGGSISCIRGNAAEIRALAQHCNTGKGVDDLGAEIGGLGLKAEDLGQKTEDLGPEAGSLGLEAGKSSLSSVPQVVTALARQTGAIVIASGATDYIGDGETVLEVQGGSPMMARVTGSGCMLSALLGAFLAIERSPQSAAACCAMMKDCGELAQRWTEEAGRGTGTFHISLLDALSMYPRA